MFILTGDKISRPSWALTQEEYLNLQNQEDLRSLIFQSEWPLLHADQIPQRWLDQDPGFPILLRHYSSEMNLPSWCIPPALDLYNLKNGQLAFRLQRPQLQAAAKLTLILVGDKQESWGNIIKRYHCDGPVIWMSSQQNQINLDWPNELKRTHHDLLFSEKELLPDRIIDLSFGEKDTYTYLHIRCLLNGASLDYDAPEMTGKCLKNRTVTFGQWEIICVP